MNYYNQIKEELINNEVYKKVKDYSKNGSDLNTYYNVGRIIVEAQGGEERAKYGDRLIKVYSERLTKEIGKGYTISAMKRMRQFYSIIEKGATVSHQLTWGHYIELLKLEDINKINYYINISINLNSSVRELRYKIKNNEYERLDNKTKEKLIIKKETFVNDLIKNPILIRNNKNYKKITDFIKNIDSTSTSEKSLGNYKNAVLICIDAVLSINRKYYKFVVPRITYFQENYSDITTLQQLLDLIEDEGITGFSKCWNYKHDKRVEILYNLVIRLIEISKGYNEQTEIENLKLWAKEITPIDYKNFNVKDIGLATFQYIRMLLGASIVKPDVHIKRTISNILNRNISDIEAINLFEQACNELNLDVATIDHNLWLLLANDVEDFPMIWKEDKWIKN